MIELKNIEKLKASCVTELDKELFRIFEEHSKEKFLDISKNSHLAAILYQAVIDPEIKPIESLRFFCFALDIWYLLGRGKLQ